MSAPPTFRGHWSALLLCASSILASCGEPRSPSPEQDAERDGSVPGETPGLRATGPAAAGATDEGAPEDSPLEELPLAGLVPARPIPIPPVILENLAFRDPARDGWQDEAHAMAIEVALGRLVASRLAGADLPAELLAAPAESFPALAIAFPGAARGRAPTVEVEVTSYATDESGRMRAACRVDLVRRPRGSGAAAPAVLAPGEAWDAHAGPAQLTLVLSSTW